MQSGCSPEAITPQAVRGRPSGKVGVCPPALLRTGGEPGSANSDFLLQRVSGGWPWVMSVLRSTEEGVYEAHFQS